MLRLEHTMRIYNSSRKRGRFLSSRALYIEQLQTELKKDTILKYKTSLEWFFWNHMNKWKIRIIDSSNDLYNG